MFNTSVTNHKSGNVWQRSPRPNSQQKALANFLHRPMKKTNYRKTMNKPKSPSHSSIKAQNISAKNWISRKILTWNYQSIRSYRKAAYTVRETEKLGGSAGLYIGPRYTLRATFKPPARALEPKAKACAARMKFHKGKDFNLSLGWPGLYERS